MTKGDAGQNISKLASDSFSSTVLTTSMPYVSYVDLASWLNAMLQRLYAAIDSYLKVTSSGKYSSTGFYNYCMFEHPYNDVFVCDGYRLCRSAKLLMALGYGNFSAIIQYDIYAMASLYVKSGHPWNLTEFKKTEYALDLSNFESNVISNSPNLSIFPLLAYHKIYNDHYRNEKWQPFQPWTCNIDYLRPSDSMNAASFIDADKLFGSATTSLIDLENSNLPIDYFTSVLPRAQYGDESVAPISSRGDTVIYFGQNGEDTARGFLFENRESGLDDNLQRIDGGSSLSAPLNGNYVSQVDASRTAARLTGIKGEISSNLSVKLSALRSATALQKYKEIQNSNDPDFAAQVLAHFGIKPKTDSRTSVFIGGDDKTLSINPQVNTNFQQGGQPDIKAIGIGDLSAGCKFTATTYGMIIGIYRAVPQLDYAHIGIDRNLFKTDATDFPIPELDSIGMQTQYRCELSAPLIGLSGHYVPYKKLSGPIDMSLTYGYAPRYAELKASNDYFEGGFCGTYSSWVTGYDQSFLSYWRRDASDFEGLGLVLGVDSLFKCRPSLLYPIFQNQWSGTVNDDKLLIGSVNSCVAVRPFSMYGLPYSK
nr:MAG TPA: Major capsid protein [Microviridae sp.]